jgi:periplasmic divalent cation tolerance protein
MNEPDAIVVLITAPTRDEAVNLAEMLIARRLAACVQVLPEMLSVYHWQGAVQRDPECLILAKTQRGLFDELDAAVRAAHSYTTPEIIALPVVDGSPAYLQWLAETMKK